jgi:hypothetical protein
MSHTISRSVSDSVSVYVFVSVFASVSVSISVTVSVSVLVELGLMHAMLFWCSHMLGMDSRTQRTSAHMQCSQLGMDWLTQRTSAHMQCSQLGMDWLTQRTSACMVLFTAVHRDLAYTCVFIAFCEAQAGGVLTQICIPQPFDGDGRIYEHVV